jgi:hypothetical protein
MSKLILNEQSSAPSTPAAGKVALYVDNTSTPIPKVLDDSGIGRSIPTYTSTSLLLPSPVSLDSQSGLSIGTRTQATAGGTTILTQADASNQIFTGTTTQTVRLPVATTLVNGQQYYIYNDSTGLVTLQYQDATQAFVLQPNSHLEISLTNNGTANGTWYINYIQNELVAPIQSGHQVLTASADNLLTGTLFRIPTGSLRVGTKIRFQCGVWKTTAAGTAVWSAKVKYGTAGTTSDGAIATYTSGTNTAAIDQAILIIQCEVLTLGSGTSATIRTNCFYVNSLTTTTGLGNLPITATSTAGFDSTAANPYFHLDITPGASAVMWGAGTMEIYY